MLQMATDRAAARLPESGIPGVISSPLAAAGYHVVAPDMRGYGDSDKPQDIDAYNQVDHQRYYWFDKALGYATAIVVGHDWGAPTAWGSALNHPTVVSAVGSLSVPFRLGKCRPWTCSRLSSKTSFLNCISRNLALPRRNSKPTTHLAAQVLLYGQRPNGHRLDARQGSRCRFVVDLPDPEQMGAWMSDADLTSVNNSAAMVRGP